jgi:hypothetical protein
VFDERVIEAFNRAYQRGLIQPESEAGDAAEADLPEVVPA